jgi:hypothetical protein
MKKIVLTAAAFALTVSSVFSQEFKPKEKDIAVGLAFENPFQASKFSLINGVSGRYFLKSDLALRANLSLARDSKTSYVYDPTSGNEVSSKLISSFGLGLHLGAEKHFSGTDRLDPYAGADLLIGYTSKFDENKNTLVPASNGSEKSSSTDLGLRLLAGADFYIFPKVYVGTEFGISFTSNMPGDVTKVTGTDSKTNKDKTNTSGIATGMTTGAFRIGFRL